MTKRQGTIKRLVRPADGAGGFGWLRPDEGGSDWRFDPAEAAAAGLGEGDRVEYTEAGVPPVKGRRTATGLTKLADSAANPEPPAGA